MERVMMKMKKETMGTQREVVTTHLSMTKELSIVYLAMFKHY